MALARKGTWIAALAAAMALAACESQNPRPPESASPAPPPVAAAARPAAPAKPPARAPEPDRPGLTLQNYQKEVAVALVRANADEIFRGKPPPLLRSIVVLQITIDSRGMLSRVVMLRSNGYPDLEKRAIAAVYRAAPYPIPGRSLLAGHASLTFLESFLFRDDGHFQVRTVAEEQATEFESPPSAPGRPAKK